MPGKKKGYTLGKKENLYDLELPSGATCQARRPGAQGLIEAGILDNFDELTSLVQTAHVNANTPKGIAAREKVTKVDEASAVVAMMADREKVGTALFLIDRLVVYVVTQPKLWVDYKLKVKDPEVKEGERPETDEEFAKRQKEAAEAEAYPIRPIELDDKMYLLQWSMGEQPDLKAFRKGSEEAVDDVAASEAVQLSSQ